jgi:hypothetical protein
VKTRVFEEIGVVKSCGVLSSLIPSRFQSLEIAGAEQNWPAVRTFGRHFRRLFLVIPCLFLVRKRLMKGETMEIRQ